MKNTREIALRFVFVSLIFILFSCYSFSQYYINKNYKSHKIAGNKLIIETDGGLIEIQAWNKEIIRFSYDKDYKGNIPLSPSVVAQASNVNVIVTQDDSTLFYSTDSMLIVIHKYPLLMEYHHGKKLLTKDTLGGFFYYQGYDYHGIKLTLKPDEKIYGFGSQATYVNRRNYLTQLFQVNRFGYEWPFRSNLNFGVPFCMSSENYGIYFDDYSHSVVRIDTENQNVLSYNTIKAKLAFFLIAGNNYGDILKKYTYLTGRQPLPPRWALGYLQSRAYYNNEKEVRSIVDSMQKSDFPMDAIIFDATWYGGLDEMGNLFWSRKRFPHYEKMISDFDAMGINVIPITQLYIAPTSEHYQHVLTRRLACHDKNFNPVYCRLQKRDSFLVYDMTNPNTWRWWWDLYKKQIDKGAKGWWLDGGEPDVYPDEILHSNGTKRHEYSNLINLLWLKMLYEGYKRNTNLRPFFMTRSGWAGAQRFGAYPLCGDEARSWAGLKAMIPVMLGASMSGIAYLHSDIGGFAPKDAVKHNEMYIRWFQLGAFSPVMRAHMVNPVPPEPVFYEKYVQDIVRKYIHLRYAFLPYNYTLSYANSMSGVPLMRPVDFYQPDNNLLNNINDEFLWGRNVLVAPVVDSVYRREIVFPEGKWIDWFTGEKFVGNAKYEVDVPLEKLPLYVRSGAIIPTSQRMSNTRNYKADSLLIHYFCDREIPRSKFRMYNDDGENPASLENKQYEFLDFAAQINTREIFFTLTDSAADGKFHSVSKRDMLLCIHGMPFVPGTTIINNRHIKIFNSFKEVGATGDYAVYMRDKNEFWIHLTWHNDSTMIYVNNEIDTIEEINDTPAVIFDFAPNPFTDKTTLDYSINQPSDINFGIYDLAGRIVKNQQVRHTVPGKYSFVWDGRDDEGNKLSPGIYMFKFINIATGQTAVKLICKLD